MLWTADAVRPEIPNDVDRLVFGIRYRRLRPTTIDLAIRNLQRRAARYRPSTLTRIGGFVLRQVLRRDPNRGRGDSGRGVRERLESGEPRRVR
jgi:hypothetical protein